MTALDDAYKTLKVLVIDDQDAFRMTIGVMLEHLGVAEVFQASDGAGGFAELTRARPDVVLCDMHMTPIDGQEFLRLVREATDEWMRGVPVIFLSGDNHLDTIRGAPAFGRLSCKAVHGRGSEAAARHHHRAALGTRQAQGAITRHAPYTKIVTVRRSIAYAPKWSLPDGALNLLASQQSHVAARFMPRHRLDERQPGHRAEPCGNTFPLYIRTL